MAGGGIFWIFAWVLKPGFGCMIIKLTSILAPNIYDCSTRGVGVAVSVDTKGERVGGEIPRWELFGH